MWQIDWGNDLEFLTEISLKRGKLTHSLETMPELKPELTLAWDVFVTLSKSRTSSLQFGTEGRQYITANAIVVSEILSLTKAFGVIDVEQRLRIVRQIQVMDAALLEKVNAGVK